MGLEAICFVLFSAPIYTVLSCHYRNRAPDRVAEDVTLKSPFPDLLVKAQACGIERVGAEKQHADRRLWTDRSRHRPRRPTISRPAAVPRDENRVHES